MTPCFVKMDWSVAIAMPSVKVRTVKSLSMFYLVNRVDGTQIMMCMCRQACTVVLFMRVVYKDEMPVQYFDPYCTSRCCTFCEAVHTCRYETAQPGQ